MLDYDTMTLRCEKLLAQVSLAISPDTRVGDLGLGQQQLVEIAKALNKQVRLLILDEPTASLTEQETAVLLDIIRDLQNHGIACIYISHKLNEVKAISDTICVIRDGQHIGTRAAEGMSEDDIITMMVGRELTALYPSEPHATGEEVLRVEHLTAWHPVNRHIKRVNDISFSLHRGEILGIAGLVGAGRTEAMQCLFGVWPGRREGHIYIDGQPVTINTCQQAISHGIAMVPEDRKKDGIVPVMAVGKNITLAALDQFSGKLSSLDDAAEQHCILHSLQRLKVKTSSPDLAIGRLSGGNQQKAILARCLLLNPRILILDEPTRGIDIGAKYEIYKLINQLTGEQAPAARPHPDPAPPATETHASLSSPARFSAYAGTSGRDRPPAGAE
jgi:D-xylose transport system ATP-binding protein